MKSNTLLELMNECQAQELAATRKALSLCLTILEELVENPDTWDFPDVYDTIQIVRQRMQLPA